MLKFIRNTIRRNGFDIVRYSPNTHASSVTTDLTDRDRVVLSQIDGFTMTSIERQASLIEAVRYIVKNGIAGCYVECGVWRGGSSMATALTLLQENDANRDLYLFDTFEGMTPPTDKDKTADGYLAQQHLDNDTSKSGYWCIADISDVRKNMKSTRYPDDRVHFIKGPVEKTIPSQSNVGPIALLRLDTDWYESTKHELIHLFPLLVSGGILIIDDYGHWAGARQAVDEYFAEQQEVFFLHRIDSTGRLLVKK
jgi:O-methyltransferase